VSQNQGAVQPFSSNGLWFLKAWMYADNLIRKWGHNTKTQGKAFQFIN
jgi:hypothetical protein